MMDWKDLCFSYSGVCAELSVNGPGFGGTADTQIKLRVPGAPGTGGEMEFRRHERVRPRRFALAAIF